MLRMQARAPQTPHALSTTATHDHKRGEDARAQLAVLSEIAAEWAAVAKQWFRMNAPLRTAPIDRGDEYQLYQTLVGAWPLDLAATIAKDSRNSPSASAAGARSRLREAKLRTSWADPDAEFETANRDFVEALLDPARAPEFLESLAGFVNRIAPAGAINALVQTALRCTLPGVPDLYQGCEFWDLSLVDPDNRRPVDYAARQSGAGGRGRSADRAGELARRAGQTGIDRETSWTCRARWPDLFAEGGYEPLTVRGARAERCLASCGARVIAPSSSPCRASSRSLAWRKELRFPIPVSGRIRGLQMSGSAIGTSCLAMLHAPRWPAPICSRAFRWRC